MRKSIYLKIKMFFAAFIGTALEFYDFTLYGFFAVLISHHFFPDTDRFVALISSYGIFAIGFFMRPIGGIIFGHIGDRFGRKKAMLFSIIAMMVPTSLMGVLPTYASIGIWAPLLLTSCRMLQGVCAGGEFSGAAIFVIEHSKQNKKFFHGSLVTVSSVVGMLLASGTAALFSSSLVPLWGWRLPFILSIFIGLLGIYVRRHVQETPEFENQKEDSQRKKPYHFTSILRHEKKGILSTFGISGFIGVLYYVPFVFFIYYVSLTSSLSNATSLSIVTLGLVFYMIFLGIAGFFADKIGAYIIMLIATTSAIILAYPLFTLLMSGDTLNIIIGEIILSIIAGTFVGPANGLTSQLFPVKDRCSGVSFSLSLGISFFGGMTPILLTYSIEYTDYLYCPAIYLITTGIMAYFALYGAYKRSQYLAATTPAPSRPSSRESSGKSSLEKSPFSSITNPTLSRARAKTS